MTPQSNYEKARDEAASLNSKTCNALEYIYEDKSKMSFEEQELRPSSILGNIELAFKAGADWHRDYSNKSCDTKIKTLETVHGKEMADLLADNKLMREALESAFIALENGCETEDDKLGLISELNHLIKTKGKV